MMQPTDRLSVALDAQAWELVMRLLAEAPYRVVAPLINDIQGQCLRQRMAGPEPEAGHE